MYYYIITLWDFITKIYLLDRQKMLRRINIFIGYEINFQLSMKKDKNIWTFFLKMPFPFCRNAELLHINQKTHCGIPDHH